MYSFPLIDSAKSQSTIVTSTISDATPRCLSLTADARQDDRVSDPWGLGSPPSLLPDPLPPLPPRLARLAEVAATGLPLDSVDPYGFSFPRVDELPEVQALAADGWRPLHGAPLYALLPAAWPPEHRTWVPDRLPRIAMRGGTTASYLSSIVPQPHEHDEMQYEDVDGEAAAAGLPTPPRDRIWLVRSPWPRIPVTAIYQLLWSLIEQWTADEVAAIYRTALDVLSWPEDRAFAACPEPQRTLMERWANADCVGEDVSHYLERNLSPDDVVRLTVGTGLDEETALAWLESLSADDIDQAVDFIVAWHAADLPGDPPPGAERYREHDPNELRRWLDAGFDLYAAAQLELAGLDRAIEWREAGFTDAETYELLRSDPALTPDEAHAYMDVEIADPDRREWIYYGFTADQAASWASAGVSPDAARLWRATGQRPADVPAGHQLPPELIAGREYFVVTRGPDGRTRYTAWDELADPPGTRGRRARRWAHDPDPWINTD